MTRNPTPAGRFQAYVAAPLPALLVPGIAQAQDFDGSLILSGGIDITGRGWGQLSNTREMAEFLLALVETTILSCAIAFHPPRTTRPSAR